MRRRLLDVTAFTTLDHVDARARGIDWTDDGIAVVDVSEGDDGDPPTVSLECELDPASFEHVDPHADELRLTPDQAIALADELRAVADEVETAGGGADTGGDQS